MINVEAADSVCMECGKEPESRAMSVGAGTGINAMKVVLCADCADYVSTKIQDKMSLLGCSTMTRDATTSELVEKFATYPLDALLDELVMCTLRWNVGPLDADDRLIATAMMERLASFGIAEKVHPARVRDLDGPPFVSLPLEGAVMKSDPMLVSLPGARAYAQGQPSLLALHLRRAVRLP